MLPILNPLKPSLKKQYDQAPVHLKLFVICLQAQFHPAILVSKLYRKLITSQIIA